MMSIQDLDGKDTVFMSLFHRKRSSQLFSESCYFSQTIPSTPTWTSSTLCNRDEILIVTHWKLRLGMESALVFNRDETFWHHIPVYFSSSFGNIILARKLGVCWGENSYCHRQFKGFLVNIYKIINNGDSMGMENFNFLL